MMVRRSALSSGNAVWIRQSRLLTFPDLNSDLGAGKGPAAIPPLGTRPKSRAFRLSPRARAAERYRIVTPDVTGLQCQHLPSAALATKPGCSARVRIYGLVPIAW